MRLKRALMKAIPEGKAKDFIQDVYAKWKCRRHARDPTDFSLTEWATSVGFLFTGGALDGFSLVLPRYTPRFIYHIGFELPSYFQMGLPPEDGLIIDAGAFPGDYAITCASLLPHARILALEPDPENRGYLEKAIAYHGMEKRIEVLPYALSDRQSPVSFRQKGTGSHILKGDGDRGKSITVDSCPLDTIVERYGASGMPVHVKMDIEGEEISVCHAAENTLAREASFAIAAYHMVDSQPSHVPLQTFFRKAGYSTGLGTASHLVLFAWKQA